jgi:hypothetical protein
MPIKKMLLNCWDMTICNEKQINHKGFASREAFAVKKFVPFYFYCIFASKYVVTMAASAALRTISEKSQY